MKMKTLCRFVVATCLPTLVFQVATPGVSAHDVFNCVGVTPSNSDELRAELVLDNLTKPVDVQSPPGDIERLFIVEQRGLIRILDLATDNLLAANFLDITTPVDDGGEKGLLGLAFHPRYASNGFFYVNYTRSGGPTGLETVIARYTVSAADRNLADAGSEMILLTFEQPFGNHNGGQVAFGPNDGYLYIASGDGGDGGDPGNRSQNPNSLLGKLLRLDVDLPAPHVPPSNPFLGQVNQRSEIWALGLRNPWRISFDPENGDLYVADVGQGDWEEINYQPAASTGGENYEWRVREGNHTFSGGTAYGPGTRVAPVLEYPHSGGSYNGCSITGGVVYRGCSMPALHGAYFFVDYCTDWIRTLRIEDGKVVDVMDRTAELNADVGGDPIDDISAFGVDGRGEVYLCDLRSSQSGDTTAKLYRLLPRVPVVPRKTFSRGNVNGDDRLDLSDAVFTLGHLFLGTPTVVPCRDALDANDDGGVDITDGVYTLNSLFTGGPLPPAPYPGCGEDVSVDELDCETSTCN